METSTRIIDTTIVDYRLRILIEGLKVTLQLFEIARQ